MAKKKSTQPRKAAPGKTKITQETSLLAVEVPVELIQGMETVGIFNQDEYITFLIASSLLNYQKIFRDPESEKVIRKIKEDSDHENYLR